jgi:hypothetical protein
MYSPYSQAQRVRLRSCAPLFYPDVMVRCVHLVYSAGQGVNSDTGCVIRAYTLNRPPCCMPQSLETRSGSHYRHYVNHLRATGATVTVTSKPITTVWYKFDVDSKGLT